ncbi:conserved Plasmodium protein, unknown function [Plasmodium malariae]|uniref:Basal complex transmembrane protein 1 n=1 Tax=Plasmodium malariae TaxID=5858 RepID=A0A1D3SN15_PLAMA|nr:conserved Plasmodium protein, unknown function [Plasmodium malariae]SCO93262.1 conserved Plasmodium protein, unknown function [Plasmodium malariae]
MKNLSKNSSTETDGLSVNINNSNDFSRVLHEIKLKQNEYEKKKSKKNTQPKIKSKNVNDSDKDNTILKKESERNATKNKRNLSKNKSKEKYVQKQKSEQNIKKTNLYDTPIFPRINSLILDHEKEECNNAEYSDNNKNAVDEKIKKSNSNYKIEKHSIYDIYAHTLKKLSIEDKSDLLKANNAENYYINKNKISENKENNKNLHKSKISNNASDESSFNFTQTYDTIYSNTEAEEINHQKDNDTKLHHTKQTKKDLVPSHLNNDKRNYKDLEQFHNKNNSSNNGNFYNNDDLFENSHVIKEHDNYGNGDSHEEEHIRGIGKEQNAKERGRKSDKYEYGKEEYCDIYKGKEKCRPQDIIKHSNMDEQKLRENSQSLDEKSKNKMNHPKSLASEDLKLRGNKNSKKDQMTYLANNSSYNEVEKENNYLNISDSLSIDYLHENEKEEKKKNEMKNKHNETVNKNNADNTMNNYPDSVYDEQNSVETSLKNFPEINMYHSVNDQLYQKKKKGYSKQNINYPKSDATTTDSDYSINEKLDMSYDHFKSKNKKKLFSIAEDWENKEKLLNVVNSKNILNIRKLLRIMREFYVGFIGLQLIYFITYLLFSNNSVYLIQIISISCTFFSLLDANYHGYLLNGFIDMCIAIFLNIAILQNIAGFKNLQSNDVLKNITISNVVFLYFFSMFSFLNGYFIYKLHSLERRNIKYVIQNIEYKTEKDF